MEVLSIKNCIDDPIFETDANLTTVLHEDCTITTNGCVTSKGFTEAKVQF